MRLTVAGLLLLTGCDLVFGLDGSRVPQPACATPKIDDGFATTMVCGTWGAQFTDPGTTITQQAGMLHAEAHAIGAAGCVTNDSFTLGPGGIVAEVTSVIAVTGAYTALSAGPADSVQHVNGQLFYERNNGSLHYAQLPYDPIAMRWWGLVGTVDGAVALYSADGLIWKELGRRDNGAPGPAQVSVYGGLSEDHANTDAATFDELIVCP